MKVFNLCLFLMAANAFAAETITPEDRFIDNKSGRLVHVCSEVDGKLIVKETCGKFWEVLPNRERANLTKEVKNYKELNLHDVVMIPIKTREGDVKMVLTSIGFMYEDGQLRTSEYYSKRFGYTPGSMNRTRHYNDVVKLVKDHPLMQYKELCAKDDTNFIYNFDDKRSFSLKKGERVKLTGVFADNTAMISLNQFGENFWGYGLNDNLPLSVDKLEICEDDKAKMVVNDTSRPNNKPAATAAPVEKVDAHGVSK